MRLNDKQLTYGLVGFGVVLVVALLGYLYRDVWTDSFRRDALPVVDQRTELQIQEEMGALIQTGNFDECKKIENTYYETVCVNNIALEQALATLDISHCQRIDNILVPIADCEQQVAFKKSVERESIAFCDEATNGEVREQCKTSFLIGLAYKKNDVRICDQEQDRVRRNECADMYVFQREYIVNPVGFDCGHFSDSAVRQDCVLFAQRDGVRDMWACDGLLLLLKRNL